MILSIDTFIWPNSITFKKMYISRLWGYYNTEKFKDFYNYDEENKLLAQKIVPKIDLIMKSFKKIDN